MNDGQTAATILIVDDNPANLLALEVGLGKKGYGLRMAGSGPEALRLSQAEDFAAILLDVQMPGMDGFELLGQVRQRHLAPATRFMVVTCRTSERDHLRGWELGADDYVVKPFNQAELAARIKAILRRTHAKEERQSSIDDGGLLVHLDKHIVESEGKMVDLSPKEFDLLVCLMKSKGNVMTREALCESVWGHEYYQNTRTVDVHVGRLRKKLGKTGDKIETIERIGYRYAFDKR